MSVPIRSGASPVDLGAENSSRHDHQDASSPPPQRRDDLSAARGVMCAIAVASLLWICIGFAVCAVMRL
jgi:hypothetical protein